MSVKKKDNLKQEGSYGLDSIVVLNPLEGIQKRPGMYIPSIGEDGWFHLLLELIDNAIDEAVGGVCKNIKTWLSADQKVFFIQDDGRGIPIGINEETKKSTLETIATVLHSGGKFDNEAYKTSGGLHGVGLTVVNALSKYFEIESSWKGKTEKVRFERGILVSSEVKNTPNKPSGTRIEFTPDKKIFLEFEIFRSEMIKNRLKSLAYLNPGLNLFFASSPESPFELFCYEKGISAWVEELNNPLKPLLGTNIFFKTIEINKEDGNKDYLWMDLSFQYNEGELTEVLSFCNNIKTIGGGKHLEGFWSGLLRVCRNEVEKLNLKEKKNSEIKIIREDIAEGLVAILSIRIKDPQFSGQTKYSLSNEKIRETIRDLTEKLVSEYFQDNVEIAERIAKKIRINAEIRVKSNADKMSLRLSKEEELSLLAATFVNSGKGKDFLIVEGKSAAGSAQKSRDPDTQSVFASQGKWPNALKQVLKKILKNKQIRDVISILGFPNLEPLLKNNYTLYHNIIEKKYPEPITIDEEFKYEEDGEEKIIPAGVDLDLEQIKIIVQDGLSKLLQKTRYEKIILMADPDVDGAHINILFITFIFCNMPHLIEGGRLFVAVPPLYRIQSGSKVTFIYSEDELEKFRQEEKKETRDIERIKGLGQMSPEELWKSTMDPETRKLYSLGINNIEETRDIIEELMGLKSSGRKRRLESGEHKYSQITVDEQNKVDIANFILVNFLRYAYAVIEERALPDIYDGLKPVQRRILYSLYQLGLTPNKHETTSANVVGKTMGDFHPHGDQSIYNAMTNMVRDDKFRYPLVFGRGNFGYDENPPAAMRYTKVKLTKYALKLLEGINQGTTKWVNNYDDSKIEPEFLPTSLPNILLNGTNGIAVGMVSSILPHNLSETLEATKELVKNPDLTVRDLMNFIPGPDLPEGGIILEKNNLPSIYEKAEGSVHIRAKVTITSNRIIQRIKDGSKSFSEENLINEKEKKDVIWITELPYKVSKSNLVINIAKLIKEKKIEGLKSIQDLSNWKGIDIRIKFNTDYDSISLLNKLYKLTNLQIVFNMKLRALIDKQPKLFSLKEILQNFIERRLDIICERSRFFLGKNQNELQNLNTRLFILENYREIISIIQKEETEEKRIEVIESKFEKIKSGEIKISDILETPVSFRQFSREQKDRLGEKIKSIEEDNQNLNSLIESEEIRREKLISELESLKNEYSKDLRRSEIISASHIIDERKSISGEETLVLLSIRKDQERYENYLNVYRPDALESTNIRGSGKELKTRGQNVSIIKSNRRDDLWCFSNFGKLYVIPAYKLSEKTNNVREIKLARLENEEFLQKIISVSEDFFLNLEERKEKNLVIVTQKGKIKKISLQKIGKISISGKKMINLVDKQDEIAEVSFTSESDYLILLTRKGKGKIIPESKIKQRGRGGYGDNALRVSPKPNLRCENHLNSLENHKKSDCCDKNLGIKAYIICPVFKQLTQEIKNCQDCANLNKKNLENNDDKIVAMMKISENSDIQNLSLLGIKENNLVVKKNLEKIFHPAQKLGGSGKHFFSIVEKFTSRYCEKHENLLSKTEERKKETKLKIKGVKDLILHIKKTISEAEADNANKEVLVNYSRELEIAKSNLEKARGEEPKRKSEIEKLKINSKTCSDCRKNCPVHYSLNLAHEKMDCCDKKRNELEVAKARIEQLTQKQKNSRGEKLKKAKNEYRLILQESLKNRVKCSRFQEINKEVKLCPDCNSQKAKKSKKIVLNNVKKGFIIDRKEKNPEVYLIVGENVSFYDKKDLLSFFQDEQKRKIQIYRDQKAITDIILSFVKEESDN